MWAPQRSFFALAEREVFRIQFQCLEDRAAAEFSPKPVAEIVVPQRFYPPYGGLLSPKRSPKNGIDLPGTMGERPGPTFQSWSSFQQDLGPLRKSWIKRSTEREGFEPSTEVASCNSLAGSRFQPLSHLSSGPHTLPSRRPRQHNPWADCSLPQTVTRGRRCLNPQRTSQGMEPLRSLHRRGLMS